MTAPRRPRRAQSWWQRLTGGLKRTSSSLGTAITDVLMRGPLSPERIVEIEETLIRTDLGVDVAARMAAKMGAGRYHNLAEVKAVLAADVEKVLTPVAKPLVIDDAKPFVILVVGVNGSGKTTTIGKLAASSAPRAAAWCSPPATRSAPPRSSSCKIWGERTGAAVIAREHGADAAGLAFDALQRRAREGADVLIVDTAGRLQNKAGLMDELEKIVRVMKKLDPAAPHAVLLVLDATVGQNAMSQVEVFRKIAGVTGLVMTKLDGTARGGILVALAAKYGLPVHFIGVGEGVDDLAPFAAQGFRQGDRRAGVTAAALAMTRHDDNVAQPRYTHTMPAKAQLHPGLKLLLDIGPLVLFFFANSRPQLFAPLLSPFLPESLAHRRARRHLRRDRDLHGGDRGGARGVLCADPAPADHAAGDRRHRAGVRQPHARPARRDCSSSSSRRSSTCCSAARCWAGSPSASRCSAMVFDSVFHLTEEGWRKLTVRWAVFFLALAVLNEIVWRTQTTDFWVSFKLFGVVPLTFLFGALQYPLLTKYAAPETEETAERRRNLIVRLLLARDDLVLDAVVDIGRNDLAVEKVILALVRPSLDDRVAPYRTDARERVELLLRRGIDVEQVPLPPERRSQTMGRRRR